LKLPYGSRAVSTGQELLGVQLTHQRRDGHAQGERKPDDVVQPEISLASFNRTHVVGVQIG